MVPALLVTAPHAARALPDWLAPRFVAGPLALWHLHDPGTGEVAGALDAAAVVLGDLSPAACDLDHELPDDGRPDRRFPSSTPSGQPLFHPPLDLAERQRLVDEVYRPWYARVRAEREALLRTWGRLVHLDLNAWGEGDLPPGHAEALREHPPLMLANGGYPDTGEGERVSCTAPALRALAATLRERFGLEVGINRRFKGGGVVRTFGHHAGNTLQLTWQRRLVTTSDELALDPTRLGAFTRTLSGAVQAWLSSL